MSYSFDMYFARADSLQEALLLANQFVDTVCTMPRMEESIRENALFLPTVKYVGKPNERKFAVIADKYFLYSLFNFRFVYWKKYKLLGMADMQDFQEDWKQISGLKGVCKVMFQSSCSQDMALKEWPQEIPYFRKVCREYEKMLKRNPLQAIRIFQKRGEYIYEDDMEEEIHPIHKNSFIKLFKKKDRSIQEWDRSFEYIVLNALYAHIFEELDLGAWLYGNDSTVFERFSINGIHTVEDLMDLDAKTRICVNNICDNIDSKKSEIVPVYLEDNKTLAKMFLYIYSRDEAVHDPKAILQKAIQEFMETEEWKKFKEKANLPDKLLPHKQVLPLIPDYWFRRYGLFPLRKNEYAEPIFFQ